MRQDVICWYIQDSARSPENVTKVSSRNAAVPQSENIGDLLSNITKEELVVLGNFNANGAKHIYLALYS